MITKLLFRTFGMDFSPYRRLVLGLVLCLLCSISWGQNKTDKVSTYKKICFYAIDKEGFEEYQKVKKEVLDGNYSSIRPIIRKMKKALKNFEITDHNRAFELWYIGNYTDFEKQVKTAKQSTLAILENYLKLINQNDALYYNHRMFLEQYLAFEAEAFYPEYWFMSMERYFSLKTVDRIRSMNKDGHKLFKNSEFFRPFDIFNSMAQQEEEDLKDYLDMDRFIKDTSTFIPYSYVILDQSIASFVLQKMTLDDATQDIDTDRQVNALKKFLTKAKSGTILLVARLNLIELRRLKNKKKAAEDKISGG